MHLTVPKNDFIIRTSNARGKWKVSYSGINKDNAYVIERNRNGHLYWNVALQHGEKAICVLSGASTHSLISTTFYNYLICHINLIFFINEAIMCSPYKLEAHLMYMLTIDNFSTVFPGIHKISVFPNIQPIFQITALIFPVMELAPSK